MYFGVFRCFKCISVFTLTRGLQSAVVYGGLWWFACIVSGYTPIVPNSGGDLWWFAVMCGGFGGLRWFVVVCGGFR